MTSSSSEPWASAIAGSAALQGRSDNKVYVLRPDLEQRVLAIPAKQMIDPSLAKLFASELTAEWNRLTAQAGENKAQLVRDLAETTRKLENSIDAIAGG